MSPEKEIRESLKKLVAIGAGESFEDGMESRFSEGLTSLILLHKERALEILSDILNDPNVNSEVVGEALRWLGQVPDDHTRSKRRKLIEANLENSSARVRDGALLGIMFMGSRKSLPALRKACETESNAELREDMLQAIGEISVLGYDF